MNYIEVIKIIVHSFRWASTLIIVLTILHIVLADEGHTKLDNIAKLKKAKKGIGPYSIFWSELIFWTLYIASWYF